MLFNRSDSSPCKSFLLGSTLCLIFASIGCRGSNPFKTASVRNAVEVTRHGDEQIAASEKGEMAPPDQRLASRTAPAEQPAVAEGTSQRRQPASEAQSLAKKRSSNETISSVNLEPDALSEKLAMENAESPSASAVQEQPPGPTQIPANESSALLSSFAKYPQEVQAEALKRLVAQAAKHAKSTQSPVDPNEKIASRLDNLPVLPPIDDTIAKSKPETAKDSLGPIDIAVAEVPAVKTTELTKSQESTPEVKTVSAEMVVPEEVQVASEKPSAKGESAGKAKLVTYSVADMFDSLIKELSKAPEDESEADRSARIIKLRHLMVLAGDVESAVDKEKFKEMSSSEQEFLRFQLLGLSRMVDSNGHPVASRRITMALPELRQATRFAAAATDKLELNSLAFCTEIQAYGQIKPFEGNRFKAGQQVILYCEIENFKSEKTAGGFKTHMQGSYDLFDDSGSKVVSQLLPADEQTSAAYMRDYYIAYQMNLAKQLKPGTYKLQLTMEDVHGKKYGQASIPLEIVE
ncbi:MAG: hypothetical protein AAF664_02130 [Planctomycetota bacterium]